MTENEFRSMVSEAVRIVRKYAPYDTGNLSRNAVQYYYDGKEAIIRVNTDIASYMPFTNEPWISPYWHGRRNPNEGWWQKAVEEVAKMIARRTGGKYDNSGNHYKTA